MLYLQKFAIYQRHYFCTCHMHIQAYVLSEQLLSMVRENCFSIEHICGNGEHTAWNVIYMLIVLVLNTLDFLILCSMGIGGEVIKLVLVRFHSKADGM